MKSPISMNIIVAEDDPVVRERLANALRTMHYEVRAFENGRLAWEAFDAEPARVIISDWQMPEMDGIALCENIRSRAKTEYTYFILVTAERTAEADFENAIDAGVDDFLTKPVSRDAIWRRLRVAKRILSYAKEIRQLKNLIPICMYCKNIREDQELWQRLEEYIHEHTGSRFSHGICPDCYDRVATAGLEELEELLKS